MEFLFKKGLKSYDEGEYFEAHEAWEDLWSDFNFKDRKFIQGLIQLAVSFVHLKNENMIGAKSLLDKCQNKFEEYRGIHRGINIEALKSSLEILKIVYCKLNNPLDFDWDHVPVLKEKI